MQQKKKFTRKISLILMVIILLGTMTACNAGNDEKANTETTESVNEENKSSADLDITLTIEQFMNTYACKEEDSLRNYQHDNYVIDNVELSDPCAEPTRLDILWEGYTEVELGMLPPDQMPNVFYEESDNHYIMYNNVKYVYVNDYNDEYGHTDSRFAEFANVWGTCETEEVKILGGLEEYGRYCAEKGVTE